MLLLPSCSLTLFGDSKSQDGPWSQSSKQHCKDGGPGMRTRATYAVSPPRVVLTLGLHDGVDGAAFADMEQTGGMMGDFKNQECVLLRDVEGCWRLGKVLVRAHGSCPMPDGSFFAHFKRNSSNWGSKVPGPQKLLTMPMSLLQGEMVAEGSSRPVPSWHHWPDSRGCCHFTGRPPPNTASTILSPLQSERELRRC